MRSNKQTVLMLTAAKCLKLQASTRSPQVQDTSFTFVEQIQGNVLVQSPKP